MGTGRILEENERLRAQLAAAQALFEAERARLEDERARLEQLLAQKAEESDAYRKALDRVSQKFELLQIKLFGKKSERYAADNPQQLPLGLPLPPARTPQPEDLAPAEPAPPRMRGVQKRRRLAENTEIPKVDIVCPRDANATCASCNGALKDIGYAESWRLEWVPGHFLRHHVQRQKCVCPKCPSEGVLVAPEPNYALPKAMCGNGLLASILIDKFADHLPLDRQVRRMARVDVDISTQVLSDWVVAGAAFLAPIARAIHHRLLTAPCLQGDDTGFPVQDGSDGKLRKGRLWVYTDQQEAYYTFTASKRGEEPMKALHGARAEAVLTDGGSEFNSAMDALGVVRAGCWSHLRRYFYDARDNHPVESHHALLVCRELFNIESEIWGRSREVIHEARTVRSKPIVDAFFAWVSELHATLRPKSLLGAALGYAVNGEPTFRAFLEHPDVPLHNNLSELLLRAPVVGRKNWLFAGSEGGAEAAATMFTVIGSCGLQGIDPWAWMVDVLSRLQDHPAKRIDELTPRGWRLVRDGLYKSE